MRKAVAEEIDKFEEDIEKLIDTGKEKGYLTFGEVNDLLPGEITSPDYGLTSIWHSGNGLAADEAGDIFASTAETVSSG